MKVYVFLFVTITLIWSEVNGLYEDQIGKFDWKKNLIGAIKYSFFARDHNNHNVAFVASEENVIASLSLKTGNILWRKVLEKGNRGIISAFYLHNNVIYAVTGTDVILVRGWNTKYGYLVHQWSIQFPLHENTQEVWFCSDDKLYKIVFSSDQSHELLAFKISNGERLFQRNISSAEFTYAKGRCAINNAFLLCLNEVGFVVTAITSENFVPRQINYDLKENTEYSIEASLNSKHSVFNILNNKKKFAISIRTDFKFYKSDIISDDGDVHIRNSPSDSNILIITAVPLSETILEIKGVEENDMQTIFAQRFTLVHPVGKVKISAADCVKQMTGQIICSVLISSNDGSLIYLKSTGKLEWTREESLASTVTAEMIELPMSDTEAEMQTEFDANESDVFSMFTRRISSHLFQLQKLFYGISGMLEKSFSTESNNESKLVRDYFNLHKIILVITKHLKIYATDNVSKEILWSHLINNDFEPFPAPTPNDDVRIPLFIQRTYRHYPHPMLCTILIRDKKTKNGVILSFNPVTGNFESPLKLNFKIKQALLLPKQTPHDYLQGIMILSEENSVYAYPEHTKSIMLEVARNLYIHVIDAKACQVNGYTFDTDINNAVLIPAWNMKCTGKIIKVSGQNPIEKVHSQGRVLADRSVLYKYINPNLIVIVSQSINPEDQKSMLTLYFVDSVTGVIVNGDVRYKASDPVHLIHSENWVVLMYFNDKARRTEVVTYELYEGKAQRNSTAFSSIQSKTLRPIIDSRAYILPTAYVEAARETITEKGITSKHVLVALSIGNIVELPWVILDPRRPFASTNEMKEEGVIPYMPEITIHTESIINYNQTLHRVRGILTSPSGLESTSLVFVYGLDLFYTRVAPSKTFDLLKEDFDYMLIITVLVLLIVLTLVSKHLAYRRALRQAWR